MNSKFRNRRHIIFLLFILGHLNPNHRANSHPPLNYVSMQILSHSGSIILINTKNSKHCYDFQKNYLYIWAQLPSSTPKIPNIIMPFKTSIFIWDQLPSSTPQIPKHRYVFPNKDIYMISINFIHTIDSKRHYAFQDKDLNCSELFFI